MRDDRVYLNYALECIRWMEKHRRSGQRRFLKSDMIQDAVLRNLQTMAESTQRLSDEIKATQPINSASGSTLIIAGDLHARFC